MNLKTLVILIYCVPFCACFNTLIAIPSTIRSLHGLFSSVALGLANAGHNVTYASPFDVTPKHTNIEFVNTSRLLPLYDEVKLFDARSTEVLKSLIVDLMPRSAHIFWNHTEAMKLWERRKNFDLFLTFSYYMEYTFPLLMDFRGTFVQICTPGVESISLSREGNWLSPAVVPSIIVNYDENMSFWERVINLPLSISYYAIQKSHMTALTSTLQQYFPDFDNPESYYDRVALTLINGHFALDGPVPLLPSQIEIGTINAKKPKPLPKDLEDFVQGSGKAGVIYFSLGSIAKSTDIPQAAKEMFVEAFKRVPQRVLWKYEGTDLKLPPNVKSQSWMPQQDILGHPKTRVFISHCGNLGTQEAKYHGVPVLGVPIAFDQPRNAARMERKGYAVVLQWETLTTDQIVSSLNKLINDTSYKERLDAVSRILQDQKDTPAERAVWWLEYVVRHKGAPHLRYAGRRLSLFQYIMLDVILFWSVVLFAVLFTVGYIIKRLCCGGKKEKRDAQRKKKTQ